MTKTEANDMLTVESALMSPSLASNLRICMALVSTWTISGAEQGCIKWSAQGGAHVRCNRILTKNHLTKPRTSMLSAPNNIIQTIDKDTAENQPHKMTSIISTIAMAMSDWTLWKTRCLMWFLSTTTSVQKVSPEMPGTHRSCQPAHWRSQIEVTWSCCRTKGLTDNRIKYWKLKAEDKAEILCKVQSLAYSNLQSQPKRIALPSQSPMCQEQDGSSKADKSWTRMSLKTIYSRFLKRRLV